MPKHGFFGNTANPEMVRRHRIEQAGAGAVARTAPGGGGAGSSFLPPGFVPQAAGAGAELGAALADQFRAGDSPEVAQAKKLQKIQQTVIAQAQELGINDRNDPEKFAALFARELIVNGMPGPAFEAMEKGRKMELERRRVEALEDQVKATLGKTTKRKPPKNAFLDEVGNLKPTVTRAIGSLIAREFGGVLNPITGEISGLDREKSQQANFIQARAEELAVTGKVKTLGKAFATAVQELRDAGGDPNAVRSQSAGGVRMEQGTRDSPLKNASSDEIQRIHKSRGDKPTYFFTPSGAIRVLQ